MIEAYNFMSASCLLYIDNLSKMQNHQNKKKLAIVHVIFVDDCLLNVVVANLCLDRNSLQTVRTKPGSVE